MTNIKNKNNNYNINLIKWEIIVLNKLILII